MWVEKSMYGRKSMGVQRTTYLIGMDGMDGMDGEVAKRWDKVKVPAHARAVFEAVKAL